MKREYSETGYEEDEEERKGRKIVSLAARRRAEVKKQKKKVGIRRIFFFCIVIAALGGILFSPIFAVQNIEMTKMVRYTEAELLERIGLAKGTNLFAFSAGRAQRILEQDSYIEKAEITRKLPNTMKIIITERLVCGYVPYVGGSYLYIDEYGRVLDTQYSFTDPLPIVNGLEFDEFQLGQVLKTKNQKSFDVVVQIAHLMTKYELLDLVLRVDVSDPADVKLYADRVEIFLGDMTDCDQKIRTMAEAMKKIPPGDRGTLDLRDTKRNPIFKYLT